MNTKPIRVLLDVDGVLADFVSMAMALLPEYGGTVNYDSWDFTDSVPEDRRNAFWAAIGQAGRCRALRPLDGAAEFVSRLRAEGHEVLFVTSPIMSSDTWMHERTAWLIEHMGARFKDVIHCHRKDAVCGDVLIDDAPKNIAPWQAAWPGGFGLLLDMPFNQADMRSHRVKSLSEAFSVIRVVSAMKGAAR